MLRSILSVLAGFALWSILWLTAQAALGAAMPGSFNDDGSTDSIGLLILLLVVTAANSFAAGFVTARLAPRSPMRHAVTLAIIQFVIGASVQIAFWELMPAWYHVTFLALLLVVHPAGGRAADRGRSLELASQI